MNNVMRCPKCGGQGTIADPRAAGEAARKARIKADVTLRRLAEEMGFSAAYLSDLENGRRNWDEDLTDLYYERLRKITP